MRTFVYAVYTSQSTVFTCTYLMSTAIIPPSVLPATGGSLARNVQGTLFMHS